MTFVSFEFCILFFPLFLGVYYAFSKNVNAQNLILFIGNTLFYLSYGIKYFFILLLCVLITYFGGILGKKSKKNGDKIFVSAFVLNILLLCFFKYCNSLLNIGNHFLPLLNSITFPQILLPTGISFYVFQSSSYLLDLKNGKIEESENNFIDYYVFVSFFPTIVSGPIQKGRELLPQLKKQRTFDYYNIQIAVIMFLYGAFIKCVIADRIGAFTDSVYSEIDELSCLTLGACCVLYSVQIYADFAGYSLMAIAVSKVLSINVNDNFRQPYFALDIPDFWRRWHVSLTGWLTEYVYFPLGGSRRGTVRKYINIFIVFFVSGIWHGSDISFVIWGLLHGFYQVFGYLTKSFRIKLCELLRINRESFIYKWFQRIVVFVLVTVSWVFFRADNLMQALSVFKNIIFIDFSKRVIPYSNTLNEVDIIILIISLIIMFVFSLAKEKVDLFKTTVNLKMKYKILITVLMFYIIVFFGYFGGLSGSSFIYAGF